METAVTLGFLADQIFTIYLSEQYLLVILMDIFEYLVVSPDARQRVQYLPTTASCQPSYSTSGTMETVGFMEGGKMIWRGRMGCYNTTDV